VNPELLTKRRHLEALLRSSDGNGNYELPEELSGWRKEAIGNDLIKALR
jgi:ribonuclease D